MKKEGEGKGWGRGSERRKTNVRREEREGERRASNNEKAGKEGMKRRE